MAPQSATPYVFTRENGNQNKSPQYILGLKRPSFVGVRVKFRLGRHGNKHRLNTFDNCEVPA